MNFLFYLIINLAFFIYGIIIILPTIKLKLREIDGEEIPDFIKPDKNSTILKIVLSIFLIVCGFFFIPHTLNQYAISRNNYGINCVSGDETPSEAELLKAEDNVKKAIAVFNYTGEDENAVISTINLGLIYSYIWNISNDDSYFTLAEKTFNDAYIYDTTNPMPYCNISMLYVAKSFRNDDFMTYLDEAYKNAFYALKVDAGDSNANFAMGNFNKTMWLHYPTYDNYYKEAESYIRKSYQINMSGVNARQIALDTIFSVVLGSSKDNTTPLENSAYPFVFNPDDYERMFYSTPVGQSFKENQESGAMSENLSKFSNLEDMYDKFIYPNQVQKSRWNLR